MKSSITNIFQNNPETTHNNTVHLHRLIRQGEVEGKIASYNFAWLEQNQKVEEHTHIDCIEYFLILTGSGVVSLNQQESAVEKGSFITISPGTKHWIQNKHLEALEFITLRVLLM